MRTCVHVNRYTEFNYTTGTIDILKCSSYLHGGHRAQFLRVQAFNAHAQQHGYPLIQLRSRRREGVAGVHHACEEINGLRAGLLVHVLLEHFLRKACDGLGVGAGDHRRLCLFVAAADGGGAEGTLASEEHFGGAGDKVVEWDLWRESHNREDKREDKREDDVHFGLETTASSSRDKQTYFDFELDVERHTARSAT